VGSGLKLPLYGSAVDRICHAPVSLVAHLAPHPGSTISFALGLSLRHSPATWEVPTPRRRHRSRANSRSPGRCPREQAHSPCAAQAPREAGTQVGAGASAGLRRRDPAPVFAATEPNGDGETIMPVRSVGRLLSGEEIRLGSSELAAALVGGPAHRGMPASAVVVSYRP
jgi:hypothetical protein